MTQRIKLIIGLIANILIYIVFFKILPYFTDKYHGCYIHQDIYKQQVKAIVIDKFINTINHNNKTITIGNSTNYYNDDNNKMLYFKKNNGNESMIFPGYLEDMYDYLNVGDSIIKERNSIYYRVVSKESGKDSIFKFETTCKDSLVKKH